MSTGREGQEFGQIPHRRITIFMVESLMASISRSLRFYRFHSHFHRSETPREIGDYRCRLPVCRCRLNAFNINDRLSKRMVIHAFAVRAGCADQTCSSFGFRIHLVNSVSVGYFGRLSRRLCGFHRFPRQIASGSCFHTDGAGHHLGDATLLRGSTRFCCCCLTRA